MLSSLICSLTLLFLLSLDGVGLAAVLCSRRLQECSKPTASLSEMLLLPLLRALLSGSCGYNPNPGANINNERKQEMQTTLSSGMVKHSATPQPFKRNTDIQHCCIESGINALNKIMRHEYKTERHVYMTATALLTPTVQYTHHFTTLHFTITNVLEN